MQIKSKPLQIALLGYGKMGRLIEEYACLKGHHVVFKSNRLNPYPSLDLNIDVAIDFSHADVVLNHIQWALKHQIPLVIGTTGWEELITEDLLIKARDGAILFSPNFSIGVNVFFKLLETAGSLFNNFQDYDVSLSEIHHLQKKDSPSGTAKKAAHILLKSLDRKQTISSCVDGIHAPEHLQISSQRMGHVPGIHEAIFDSDCDTIEIKHSARNRSGFAKGAIVAAEWLIDKKGWFTFEDCFNQWLRSLKGDLT